MHPYLFNGLLNCLEMSKFYNGLFYSGLKIEIWGGRQMFLNKWGGKCQKS